MANTRMPSGHRGRHSGGRPCPLCLRPLGLSLVAGGDVNRGAVTFFPLGRAHRFRWAWRPGSLRQHRYARRCSWNINDKFRPHGYHLRFGYVAMRAFSFTPLTAEARP